MTPQEAAARLRNLSIETEKTIINGVRRAMGYWRKLILTGVTQRGIGRAIWGEKKLTTLRAIVKRTRVRKEGDAYTGGLEIKGIAALMETGGRTLAHPIRAKLAPKLAFMGRTGFVRIDEVNHPGSNVPATPSAAPALSAVEAFMQADMVKGTNKAIEKAGLLG